MVSSTVGAATWHAVRRVLQLLLQLLCSLWAAFWAMLYRFYVGHKRRVVLVDWTELEFCPKEVQEDREAVLCGSDFTCGARVLSFSGAVKQDWRALEFAGDLRLDLKR